MNRAATEAEDTLGRTSLERTRQIREVIETIRVVYEDDQPQIPLPFNGDQRPELVIDAEEAERLLNEREVQP